MSEETIEFRAGHGLTTGIPSVDGGAVGATAGAADATGTAVDASGAGAIPALPVRSGSAARSAAEPADCPAMWPVQGRPLWSRYRSSGGSRLVYRDRCCLRCRLACW